MSPREDRTAELAQQIKDLRTEAGLTGVRLAELIGISQSKVSKIENGRLLPTLEDIENIAEALDLKARQRKQLVELAQAVLLDVDRWRLGAISTFKSRQQQTAHIENDARLVRTFNPYTIPGLLQTAEFARELLSRRFTSEEALEEALASRMARQQALYNTKRRFQFVLGEPAFLWQVASNETMRAQAVHLQQLASLRNVDISLLPFSKRPPLVPHGSFAIYDDALVTVETFSAEMTLRDVVDVEDFVDVFEKMRSASQSGDAMKRTIDRALRRWSDAT